MLRIALKLEGDESMKRSPFMKFLVLTLTLLVGSLAVTATERPFSLNGTGIAIPVIDGNGNVVGAEPTGSGNATHLGMFTNTGHVDFTPDASNPTILHPSGGGVFTAANGDKLNFVIISGALDLTTGIGTGDFAFTGGTGRFANATGRTSGVIQHNVITGAYVLTLVGNIDY
jgi:hypothetical protein